MQDGFLGIGSNLWLAIVGGAYALATLLLALWTNIASIRAVQVAKEQMAASSALHDKQLETMREAALIQARASSISNNRQGWINSLREEVTGFLTDADMTAVVRDEMAMSDARSKEQLRIERALVSHIFKVRLLINPTEGESSRLVEMLEEARQGGLTAERREAIVSLTQIILKTEWERVKSGV